MALQQLRVGDELHHGDQPAIKNHLAVAALVAGESPGPPDRSDLVVDLGLDLLVLFGQVGEQFGAQRLELLLGARQVAGGLPVDFRVGRGRLSDADRDTECDGQNKSY